MKYILMKKGITNTLYVAESHYFSIEGKRDLTLTDKKDYAERFNMEEVNKFIDEYPKEYSVLEDDFETKGEEE